MLQGATFNEIFILPSNYRIVARVRLITVILSVVTLTCRIEGRGTDWPRKQLWGCVALKIPFCSLYCSSKASHFKQESWKVISQYPILRKKSVHKTSFWENFWNFCLCSLNFHPKFSSQVPNLEIVSSQAQDPLFKGKNQFTSPTIPNPGKNNSASPWVESRFQVVD